MIAEAIKESWDKLLESGLIRYFPEENAETTWENVTFPLRLGYIPERANRFAPSGERNGVSGSPLGERIWDREDCLFVFDNLVLLANKRPIGRYHSILCTKEHLPQNAFAYEEIEEVSRIVELTGMRSFLNMRGTAATLDHFHTQALFGPFNLEALEKEYVTPNTGYLKGYPGGNFLVSGGLRERCEVLMERIARLSASRLPPTVKHDGSSGEGTLYTLLFWDNHILLIPRRKETPSFTQTMSGGLELSGHVMLAEPVSPGNPLGGVRYESILQSIREVAFDQEEIAFLHAF